MTVDTSTTNGPYTPVSSQSQIEEQYSWILQGNVEDVSYVLIVVVTMILVMSYYSLNLSDLSNESGATALASNSTTDIANELSTLQSAVYYDSDTDSYKVDTSIFTQADAKELSDSITDLFFSDSNTGYTWDDMAITDPDNGTTYYLQPDGTWSTTAFTGENEVTINGHTFTPAEFGLTGDSSVSDMGLYMMASAVYTVDIDVFNGDEIDVDTTFPTESEYTSGTDPVLTYAYTLWNDLIVVVDPDSGNSTSLIFAVAEAENGNLSLLQTDIALLGSAYGSSAQDGGGSQLSSMTQDANSLLTQLNNTSTLLTNQIQTYTQWISTMYALGQVIIQDATQANMNSVNSQKT